MLIKPMLTIGGLKILTQQSYEKSRQDFKVIKIDYENTMMLGESLPNSRELPLNDYVLEVLNQKYGISKQRIIENIQILDQLGIK